MEGKTNYDVKDNSIPETVMKEFVETMMAGISAFYEKPKNKEGFKKWENALASSQATQ